MDTHTVEKSADEKGVCDVLVKIRAEDVVKFRGATTPLSVPEPVCVPAFEHNEKFASGIAVVKFTV
jgi:hypothetical protein